MAQAVIPTDVSSNVFNVFHVPTLGTHVAAFNQVRMHPLAVLVVTDAFARRPEGATRAIGTLLGYENGNVVEITDAFTVNHKDDPDGSVMMDQEYHRKMLKLKRKVCPKEHVVGWFSTGAKMEPSSVVIHTFYQSQKDSQFAASSQLPSPIHVIVDTECMEQRLTVKAFVQLQLAAIDNTLAHFQEIPLEIDSPETEGGMALLQNVFKKSTAPKGEQEELGGFEDGLKTLLDKFVKVQAYTAKLKSENKPVPPKYQAAVREFSRVLKSAEPVLQADQFESLCSSTLQDTLMCVYLAQLARTQSVLAEKINSVATAFALDDF